MTQQLDELNKNTASFYAMVRNLHQFSEVEMQGVLTSQLSLTWNERFALNCYLRGEANVHSLLKLQELRDCQAAAMIARSLIEIAIESAILDKIDGCEMRVLVFSDSEKLARAMGLVSHATDPASHSESMKFINENQARIQGLKASLWGKTKDVRHWSGKDLAQRAGIAGEPFAKLYWQDYKLRSWHSHAGFVGFQSSEESFYLSLLADSYLCAATAYELLLLQMIAKFRLYSVNQSIREKIKVAKLAAFTSDQADAEDIYRHLVIE